MVSWDWPFSGSIKMPFSSQEGLRMAERFKRLKEAILKGSEAVFTRTLPTNFSLNFWSKFEISMLISSSSDFIFGTSAGRAIWTSDSSFLFLKTKTCTSF